MSKLMTLSLARYVFPSLFLLILLGGCASTISSSVLLSRLGNDQVSPVVVDVRTRYEFKAGHLPGAINIPLLILPFQMSMVPVKSKDDSVVVYCAHGPRASLAGFILSLAGFENILHLQGDMAGWRADGLVVEQ